MVKSLMRKWKANVYCFQETKISKEVEAMAKQLWSCRWMKCGYLKAEGSCGGVLMMWDNRSWRGTLVEAGQFSITYKFVSTQNLIPGTSLECMLPIPGMRSYFARRK
ncbi:hypothetical protein KY290_013061 [Solanum tuberosum]|uniref:Uncharacterized protein n=1 Tax=Solanum tuberosum TaxID=4113 RepID=A0ABQ7VMW3_SOLTU|nr:hypothetical protein KY285_012831 [Solanum tuberosum]KAH0769080.1 hypothetical protein KY290_013061 [Solanum tuberosum]